MKLCNGGGAKIAFCLTISSALVSRRTYALFVFMLFFRRISSDISTEKPLSNKGQFSLFMSRVGLGGDVEQSHKGLHIRRKRSQTCHA